MMKWLLASISGLLVPSLLNSALRVKTTRDPRIGLRHDLEARRQKACVAGRDERQRGRPAGRRGLNPQRVDDARRAHHRDIESGNVCAIDGELHGRGNVFDDVLIQRRIVGARILDQQAVLARR